MSRYFSVATKLCFGAMHEVSLFVHFDVTSTTLLSVFILTKRLLISCVEQGSMSLFECFSSSSQVKLSGISNFGELGSAFLGLVEVIVCSLNSVIRLTVFTFLHSIQAPQLIDVLLVTVALLLEFAQFEMGVINFFLQPIA